MDITTVGALLQFAMDLEEQHLTAYQEACKKHGLPADSFFASRNRWESKGNNYLHTRVISFKFFDNGSALFKFA